MSLPSLDVLEKPRECEACGEPIYLIDPVYCPACADRLAVERIRESSNEYRRQARIALEMEMVRRRTRLHLSKPAPAQNTCVTCEGRGGFVTFGADSEKYDGGAECPDCNGTGVA